jgi:hypothetical protein
MERLYRLKQKCVFLNQLLMAPTQGFSEACIKGRLVYYLRSEFLDPQFWEGALCLITYFSRRWR